MNKKNLSLALLSLLLIAAYLPLVSALPPNGTDTTTLVVDTISEPETVDPAWAYDTASSEVVENIYEPLAMYKVDRRLGPYEAGLVDQFTPRVAKFGNNLGNAIYIIRPNGDGRFKGWSAEPTQPKTDYEKVDEVEPNDDTDYLYAETGNREESFDLSDTTATGSILHVKVFIVARNTAVADEQITPMLVIGKQKKEYFGGGFTPTTSYGSYSCIWPNNPATQSAWTWADVNDLEAGFMSVRIMGPSFDELRVTQLYVEISVPAEAGMYSDIPDYIDPDTGVLIKKRLIFEINVGIPFHRGGDGTNWGTLTTEDVEYSFERMMVQDRDGGPQWMLYEYLLNAYSASSPTDDALWGTKIDHSVDHNATHVWFNIASNFPLTTILQINAKIGIICKDWAASLGDFDGNWAAGWQTIYDTWHNPPTSFIEYDEANAATKPVGTGPYQFWHWRHGDSWSITKFDAYWDGWPSKVLEDPVNWDGSDNRISGYLTRVTWYYLSQWTTRRPRFLAGNSDMTYVDRLYRNQVLGMPGIRCYYPTNDLSCTGYFFTFDITTTSPYVPTFYPSGTFGTNGIPADLFSDINVRRGFAYAFDYNSWLTNVYLGEGWQPPEAIIRGVAYNRRPSENPYATYDEESPVLSGPPYKYYYNPALATYYLQLAYGGQDTNNDGVVEVPGALWTGGMRFVIPYSTGNVARQLAAEMITAKINSLGNPLFQLDPPVAVPWGPVMLPQMVNGELPIFLIGWAAAYPDPHNFVFPFYHPEGIFAQYQKYNDPTMKSLIETGIKTPDGPLRSDIYKDIQERAVNQAPSVTLVQALGRHFERDWVRGWYHNPIAQNYYYHFYKAKSEFGDVTNDGLEDINDKAFICAHMTETGGPYNPSADINGGTGGTAGSESGYVVGIPDGRVDMLDLDLLSATWD